ncbi:MAG: hypothetical protein CUN55_09950 [Phototrophicales bacterium]|nr:MAG: hypothetical protein CUN55_09950 [Phototrophicales bacterium]
MKGNAVNNPESTYLTTQLKRICFICKSALVDDAIYCHRCGTKQPPPKLILRSEEQVFELQDASKVWIVGRTIPATGHIVDVDLGEAGGKLGVSRRHAELAFDEQNYQWTLRDASSQYGTFVDDQQVQPEVFIPLQAGQRVRFGGIEFSIELQY